MSRLIVCERTGRWAMAWRPWLTEGEIALHQVRSLSQCRQALDETPSAAVALDAGSIASQGLFAAIADWTGHFPRAIVIVTAPPSWLPDEFVLREAGALHVGYSPRTLGAAATLVRRHLANGARENSQPEASAESLEQAIHRRLPWNRYAKASGATS